MIKRITKKLLLKLGYSIKKIPAEGDFLVKLHELIGFPIDPNKYTFFKKGFNILRELKIKKNASFELRGSNFIITIDHLSFSLNTWEEILILKEIFIEGIYNFTLPKRFSLIDIGMNVGMTSLFFANQPNCEAVFSYEPFKGTFEMATKNLSLNPCASKIKPNNFGLGYPARKLLVDYNEEFKGSMGMNGMPEFIRNRLTSEKTEFQIEDVAFFITDHTENYNDHWVAKIDCEGAEYEIIDRLDAQDLLNKISVYIACIIWSISIHDRFEMSNNKFH